MTVGQARLFVLHDIAQLHFDPAARGYAAVISGHSHKACEEVRRPAAVRASGNAGAASRGGAMVRSELVALSV